MARVNLIVTDETKQTMQAIAQRSSLSQGQVVDEAVRLYASSLPPDRAVGGRMRFDAMPLGAVFVVEDSYDQYMYKVSTAEAVHTASLAMANSFREPISPEAEYRTTGEFVVVHTAPTEIERAALTLLNRANAQHPALSAWIQAMVRNPEERRDLEDFVLHASLTVGQEEAPLIDVLQSEGYVYPRRRWDREHDVGTAILECRPKGRYNPDPESRYFDLRDSHILRLAQAVQDYRVRGRPDGDQNHVIRGLGGSHVIFTASLATAVVEYHLNIGNWYTHHPGRLLGS